MQQGEYRVNLLFRRSLIRFLALQVMASTSAGVCVAYAFGPSGPKPYSERISFALRLTADNGGVPEQVADGFRLRLRDLD